MRIIFYSLILTSAQIFLRVDRFFVRKPLNIAKMRPLVLLFPMFLLFFLKAYPALASENFIYHNLGQGKDFGLGFDYIVKSDFNDVVYAYRVGNFGEPFQIVSELYDWRKEPLDVVRMSVPNFAGTYVSTIKQLPDDLPVVWGSEHYLFPIEGGGGYSALIISYAILYQGRYVNMQLLSSDFAFEKLGGKEILWAAYDANKPDRTGFAIFSAPYDNVNYPRSLVVTPPDGRELRGAQIAYNKKRGATGAFLSTPTLREAKSGKGLGSTNLWIIDNPYLPKSKSMPSWRLPSNNKSFDIRKKKNEKITRDYPYEVTQLGSKKGSLYVSFTKVAENLDDDSRILFTANSRGFLIVAYVPGNRFFKTFWLKDLNTDPVVNKLETGSNIVDASVSTISDVIQVSVAVDSGFEWFRSSSGLNFEKDETIFASADQLPIKVKAANLGFVWKGVDDNIYFGTFLKPKIDLTKKKK